MKIEGYCVKCRTKKVMKSISDSVTKDGKPMVRGICPDCGTRMVRMGCHLPK